MCAVHMCHTVLMIGCPLFEVCIRIEVTRQLTAIYPQHIQVVGKTTYTPGCGQNTTQLLVYKHGIVSYGVYIVILGVNGESIGRTPCTI